MNAHAIRGDIGRATGRDRGIPASSTSRRPATRRRRKGTGIDELANPPLGHPKLGSNLLDADLHDTTLP